MFTKIVNNYPYTNLGDYMTEADVQAINQQLLIDFDKWAKNLVGKLRNDDNNGSAKKAIDKFEADIKKANFVESVKKCQNGQVPVDDVNKSVQAIYTAYNELKTDCEKIDADDAAAKAAANQPPPKPVDNSNNSGSGTPPPDPSSSKRRKDGEDSENWKKLAWWAVIFLIVVGLAAFLLLRGCSGCSKTAESAKKVAIVSADSLRVADSLKSKTIDSLRAENDRLNQPEEWYRWLDSASAVDEKGGIK